VQGVHIYTDMKHWIYKDTLGFWAQQTIKKY